MLPVNGRRNTRLSGFCRWLNAITAGGEGEPTFLHCRCNRCSAFNEQGLMSRPALLILALILALFSRLPGALTASVVDPAVNASCLICCEDQTGACDPTLAACDRICAAAVVPVLPEIAQVRQIEITGSRLAQTLTSISGKPIPPPPRSQERPLSSQFDSGELT